ncbi:hypothetical protein NMG60_11006542 [Bertholletia excelsa]
MISKLNTRKADIERSNIHESDLESIITSSPVGNSFSQFASVKDLGSSSSCTNSACCSGSVSEADKGDDCLDDWEAVTDALIADKNSELETARKSETNIEIAVPEVPSKNSRIILEKPEHGGRTKTNCRVWHHDDAFCPQGLPDLSKQRSISMKTKHLCGQGTNDLKLQSFLSQPSSCPICYEDLDATDSSFFSLSLWFPTLSLLSQKDS